MSRTRACANPAQQSIAEKATSPWTVMATAVRKPASRSQFNEREAVPCPAPPGGLLETLEPRAATVRPRFRVGSSKRGSSPTANRDTRYSAPMRLQRRVGALALTWALSPLGAGCDSAGPFEAADCDCPGAQEEVYEWAEEPVGSRNPTDVFTASANTPRSSRSDGWAP